MHQYKTQNKVNSLESFTGYTVSALKYHHEAPQSDPGKLLWGNNQIHLLIVEKLI